MPYRNLHMAALLAVKYKVQFIINEAIARLDKAIIVAGPAGEGRLELVLEFIERLQKVLCSTRTGECPLLSPDAAGVCKEAVAFALLA